MGLVLGIGAVVTALGCDGDDTTSGTSTETTTTTTSGTGGSTASGGGGAGTTSTTTTTGAGGQGGTGGVNACAGFPSPVGVISCTGPGAGGGGGTGTGGEGGGPLMCNITCTDSDAHLFEFDCVGWDCSCKYDGQEYCTCHGEGLVSCSNGVYASCCP